MNPFNQDLLTPEEFEKDCLNFLNVDGFSVKASRLFLGQFLEKTTRKISDFFNVDFQSFKHVKWNNSFKSKKESKWQLLFNYELLKLERFGYFNNLKPNYSMFENFEDAYFHLMDEITDIQINSLKLAIGKTDVKTVYIDGGFSSNEIFINFLKNKLPDYTIITAPSSSGSALGAAHAIN